MPITAAQVEGRAVTPPHQSEAPVPVKVTRRGHGKIATGHHDRTYGDELYAADEVFEVAEDIARELEERGLVVFLPKPEPVKEEQTTVSVESVPEESPKVGRPKKVTDE